MDNIRLTYTPLPDATPESELDALVAVYKFILDCHDKRKATEDIGGESDVKGASHDHVTQSVPRE